MMARLVSLPAKELLRGLLSSASPMQVYKSHGTNVTALCIDGAVDLVPMVLRSGTGATMSSVMKG